MINQPYGIIYVTGQPGRKDNDAVQFAQRNHSKESISQLQKDPIELVWDLCR
jgi:hypothetical protein